MCRQQQCRGSQQQLLYSNLLTPVVTTTKTTKTQGRKKRTKQQQRQHPATSLAVKMKLWSLEPDYACWPLSCMSASVSLRSALWERKQKQAKNAADRNRRYGVGTAWYTKKKKMKKLHRVCLTEAANPYSTDLVCFCCCRCLRDLNLCLPIHWQ